MTVSSPTQTPSAASLQEGRDPHDFIPGGAHTYSKGDDQFPKLAPRHIERGQGAKVWDEAGVEYIDWTMGLRSVGLGHNFGPVTDAVVTQLKKGTNFGRPATIEMDLAEVLIDLIPSAEMVKFSKDGSTATTAAIKLARAYTGRKYVAFCRQNPFFSYDDWFIGTTPCSGGIPEEHVSLSLPFCYNCSESLCALFAAYADQIAAVILEPCMDVPPADGFLQKVRDLCTREGAVMILDEMITGFRWHLQGAQCMFDVVPDLSTFGKGLANGFSTSALVGRRDIMKLGGVRHDQQRVFLISTTHGAENHSLAAALETTRFFKNNPVIEHFWSIGDRLINGANAIAKDHGIEQFIQFRGFACRPEYVCRDLRGEVSLGLRTLFMQELIKRQIFLSYITPSWSHTAAHVDQTLNAMNQAMAVYAKALNDGWETYLVGNPIKPVFRAKN